MKNTKNADISNIYRLDGQVPIMKAIPFGLQHILAMFVANTYADHYYCRCRRS